MTELFFYVKLSHSVGLNDFCAALQNAFENELKGRTHHVVIDNDEMKLNGVWHEVYRCTVSCLGIESDNLKAITKEMLSKKFNIRLEHFTFSEVMMIGDRL